MLPLILGALALGGLGVSAGANLYSQSIQRNFYNNQARAYGNLHAGYAKYLATQGRSVNPDRAWTSYYGQQQAALSRAESSIAQSVGTVGGTIGAGAFAGRGLYKDYGKTSRWS